VIVGKTSRQWPTEAVSSSHAPRIDALEPLTPIVRSKETLDVAGSSLKGTGLSRRLALPDLATRTTLGRSFESLRRCARETRQHEIYRGTQARPEQERSQGSARGAGDGRRLIWISRFLPVVARSKGAMLNPRPGCSSVTQI
jgi:hypothetical protein